MVTGGTDSHHGLPVEDGHAGRRIRGAPEALFAPPDEHMFDDMLRPTPDASVQPVLGPMSSVHRRG
jgi:hypothetical protein